MDTYKQQPSSQSHPSQLQTKLVTTKNLSVEHINNSGILEVSFDYKTDDTVAGNYGMFLTGKIIPRENILREDKNVLGCYKGFKKRYD